MTSPERPVVLTVLDKDRYVLGDIGDPLSFAATVGFNSPQDLTFEMAVDGPRSVEVRTPGASVICRYHGLDGYLVSGPVRRSQVVTPDGVLLVEVDGAEQQLWHLLGWPRPGSALTAQTTAQDLRRGKLETVVKGVLGAAITRLGLPIEVEADEGRGPTVTLGWRMQPLADQIVTALSAAGLGLSVTVAEPVEQDDGRLRSPGLYLSIYEPRTHPHELGEEQGSVLAGTLESAAPKYTRWVLGGAGEGAGRLFFSDVDTDAEQLWGPLHVREEFLEASGIGAGANDASKPLADAKAVQAQKQAAYNAALIAYIASQTPSNEAAVTAAGVELTAAKAVTAAAQADYDTRLAEADPEVQGAFALARLEAAATAGIALTLSDTPSLTYGDAGVLRGDLLSARVGGELVTKRLDQCTFDWEAESTEGLQVVPTIGRVQSDSTRIATVIAGLVRRARAAVR